MDLTELSAIARFRIGDRVRLVAGLTWVVIGRYYRRRSREIVYDIQDPRTLYITGKAEDLLRPEPEEVY